MVSYFKINQIVQRRKIQSRDKTEWADQSRAEDSQQIQLNKSEGKWIKRGVQEYHEQIRADWSKKSGADIEQQTRVRKVDKIGVRKRYHKISAEQGQQRGEKGTDISGDKLELHAKYNVGKMEVACSNRDIILRFSRTQSK